MTSNLGSHFLLEGIDDNGEITQNARDEVDGLLKITFRPEFLNRLDEIVFFKPLTQRDVVKIVDLMLTNVAARLKDMQLSSRDRRAKNGIAKHRLRAAIGARP
jgi:ATP-dependent Clp protease ATP-binding subunit ClpB